MKKTIITKSICLLILILSFSVEAQSVELCSAVSESIRLNIKNTLQDRVESRAVVSFKHIRTIEESNLGVKCDGQINAMFSENDKKKELIGDLSYIVSTTGDEKIYEIIDFKIVSEKNYEPPQTVKFDDLIKPFLENKIDWEEFDYIKNLKWLSQDEFRWEGVTHLKGNGKTTVVITGARGFITDIYISPDISEDHSSVGLNDDSLSPSVKYEHIMNCEDEYTLAKLTYKEYDPIFLLSYEFNSGGGQTLDFAVRKTISPEWRCASSLPN